MILDPTAAVDFLQRAGVIGLLVLILVSGARRGWVWGYQLQEMQIDRDRWRDLALRSMGQANRSMDVAQRGVELVAKELR